MLCYQQNKFAQQGVDIIMASNRLARFLQEQFKNSNTREKALDYFHELLKIESEDNPGHVNESWFSRCFDNFPDFLNKEHPAVKESLDRYLNLLALVERENIEQSQETKDKLTNTIHTEIFYLLSKLVYVACSELYDNNGDIRQDISSLVALDKVNLIYEQHRFVIGYISHAMAAIQAAALNEINRSWLLSDENKYSKQIDCHHLNEEISRQLKNNITEAKYLEFFGMTIEQRRHALKYKKNWQDSDAVKFSLAIGFGLALFGSAAIALSANTPDNPGSKF